LSFMSVNPEALGPAAQNLSGIGSAIRSANTTAGVSTTQVAAAAQDEVSAAIAGAFGSYGQQYQALITQAGQFHDRFVGLLNAGAGSYASTEAANMSTLNGVNAAQDVPGFLNVPEAIAKGIGEPIVDLIPEPAINDLHNATTEVGTFFERLFDF
jgi:hypothetical protein